jgi:hypothetical protein
MFSILKLKNEILTCKCNNFFKLLKFFLVKIFLFLKIFYEKQTLHI